MRPLWPLLVVLGALLGAATVAHARPAAPAGASAQPPAGCEQAAIECVRRCEARSAALVNAPLLGPEAAEPPVVVASPWAAPAFASFNASPQPAPLRRAPRLYLDFGRLLL